MVKRRPVAGRVYDLVFEVSGSVFPYPNELKFVGKGIYAGRTLRERMDRHFFYIHLEDQVFMLYRFDKFKVSEGNIVVLGEKYAKRKIFDQTGFFEEWFKRKGL